MGATRRTTPSGSPAEHRPGPVLPWLLATGLAVAALLFLFNPAQHGFYPACMFYKLTGLQCPGCGSLRALHELLHGHLLAAFRLNPLFVSSLPVVGGWFAYSAWCRSRGRETRLNLSARWLWLGVAVIVLFGVGRNL